MTTIPIFFTFDRYYVVAAQVALYSMLKNASKDYRYELFFLHTDLNEKVQKRISRVIEGFPATAQFINVSAYNGYIQKLEGEVKAHFSKEIFYKLIVPDMFPQYDRIICSDVDVAYPGDISQAYFIEELEHCYLAGVGPILTNDRMKAYNGKGYNTEELEALKHALNAGFLVYNLKLMREDDMQQKLVDFYMANYPRLMYPEQDCMALCCYPHIKYVSMQFNVLNIYYTMNAEQLTFFPDNFEYQGTHAENVQTFKAHLAHPTIIHYIGPRKPWNSFGVPQQKLWFRYMREVGCTTDYLCDLPRQLWKKMRRLNLSRFLHKIKQRL